MARRRPATDGESTRGPQKTIRFAKGSDLLDWYEHEAEEADVSTNGVLILALEEYRAKREKPTSEIRERTA